MKKLLVVLSLAMSAFSFQANAANLSWGSINGTFNNGTAEADKDGTSQSLWGTQSGLANGTGVDASWKFNLSAASGIVINVSSLIVNPTWLTSVKLDGSALTQIGGSTNGAWLFNGLLSNGTHTITLGGTTNGGNSGYQLNVNVAQTPIPAAIWLFGSALMGLTGLKRKSVITGIAA